MLNTDHHINQNNTNRTNEIYVKIEKVFSTNDHLVQIQPNSVNTIKSALSTTLLKEIDNFNYYSSQVSANVSRF